MAIVWTFVLLLVSISQVSGLRCVQCVGTSSSCRLSAKTCPSYETTCFSLAYKQAQVSSTSVFSETLIKGCSTPELCNQTSIIDIGTQSIYMSASCCEKDFCNLNPYSTTPVFSNRLQCSACTDTSKSCQTANTTVFCDGVNNWCVDRITRNYTNGVVTGSTYSKGCGSGQACNTLLSYNTGAFQHYTQYVCCNKGNNCNNLQKSVNVLTNNNGITCYGCQDTGNNECAPENQTIVHCKGIQLRCMETFNASRQTWFKGCSTVSFCSSTYPHLSITNISEIQCCAGSLCNNSTREYSTNPISSHAYRTNVDFKLLIFLFIFSWACLRHFP
ncbi:urokinase plasminogen activator surface receptor-like [Pelodytes ibericus]